jgi:hypothetical protein
VDESQASGRVVAELHTECAGNATSTNGENWRKKKELAWLRIRRTDWNRLRGYESERRMDTEQHGDSRESEFLTGQDRANGFSVHMNNGRNVSLLKEGKPVAWFSAAVLPETVRAMVRLIANREEARK